MYIHIHTYHLGDHKSHILFEFITCISIQMLIFSAGSCVKIHTVYNVHVFLKPCTYVYIHIYIYIIYVYISTVYANLNFLILIYLHLYPFDTCTSLSSRIYQTHQPLEPTCHTLWEASSYQVTSASPSLLEAIQSVAKPTWTCQRWDNSQGERRCCWLVCWTKKKAKPVYIYIYRII